MSKGIDLQFVQQSYQRMPDDELIRIATTDAHGLTPEAIAIVKEEIRKRGLNANIARGIEAQTKTYTIEDIDRYCDIICKLSCPTCGNDTQRLNATLTGEVISFVILTNYRTSIQLGCPGCLHKANNDALMKTVLLGWWGIPWGIIRTIHSIILNVRNKRLSHTAEHTEYLRTYALNRIGELEAYKDDKEQLQQIVRRNKLEC